MPPVEKISTITEKGQVTVPKPAREALGLGYGGRVAGERQRQTASRAPSLDV
ncbi:hypothetical protein [Rhizobium leguminosarum]|uniref:hypothetical protein n=1 Tax=Rhizobium leguminosarum TaxID=384 RepID=UPI0010310E99|nr:hypothetical protein [Rhizobium leguminosarum]TAV92053.1 hypothetical protein ELI22_23680 [Rhizobium leguminosarum]TAV96661.1 hypothetical protein ELI21_23835 [Rhizobium leguminosarum]TAW37738.1 hypothetical protein ELI23_23885 [Rhizobium leguminosarum]